MKWNVWKIMKYYIYIYNNKVLVFYNTLLLILPCLGVAVNDVPQLY